MTTSANPKDANSAATANSTKPNQERRSQARADSVLSRIEDATYAILRKYDKSA